MPNARVAIEPSMAHHFQLEAWDALDDGGKLALGDYLSEQLQAHGWDVPEPLTLSPFGPPDELRSVLQWREPTSGMTFSFIPGGTFRPGCDEAQLARLKRRRRAMGNDDDDMDPGTPLDYHLYSCDLRLKGPVEIPPIFMAMELVRPSLPRLRSVVELPEVFFEKKEDNFNDYLGDAIGFRWEQVESVLTYYGWSLPTSAEFEWALRGGDNSLFYWDDDVSEYMGQDDLSSKSPAERTVYAAWVAAFDDALLSGSFAPERPRAWPWCNRFGLAGMLPISTWCARSTVLDDPAPLIVRGGTAGCYPWVDTGCWEMILSAFEFRYEVESKIESRKVYSHAIRPLIRLDSGA